MSTPSFTAIAPSRLAVVTGAASVGSGGNVFADPAVWDQVIGVNLLGVLNGIQAFVPAMIERIAPAVVINPAAGQHRLQCQQGRREGANRGAGAQPG